MTLFDTFFPALTIIVFFFDVSRGILLSDENKPYFAVAKISGNEWKRDARQKKAALKEAALCKQYNFFGYLIFLPCSNISV